MNSDEQFDRIDASIKRQMELFESRFDSLESEMHKEIGGVKDEMKARFDRVDARLDRMEARLDKIAAGTHYVTRLVDWSEKQDAFQADTLRRLNDLADRVKRLEGGAAA
jgi:hypothetical protein